MFGDVPIHMVGIVLQRKYDVLVDDWLIQYTWEKSKQTQFTKCKPKKKYEKPLKSVVFLLTNEEVVDNDLNNIVDVFEFVDVGGSILDIVQYLIG